MKPIQLVTVTIETDVFPDDILMPDFKPLLDASADALVKILRDKDVEGSISVRPSITCEQPWVNG